METLSEKIQKQEAWNKLLEQLSNIDITETNGGGAIADLVNDWSDSHHLPIHVNWSI